MDYFHYIIRWPEGDLIRTVSSEPIKKLISQHNKRKWAKIRLERDDSVSGRFGSKPVKVGAEYELEVNEISKRGDGVARVKGFVVFIAGAQKGQKYKVKITKVADRFAVGKIEEEGQAAESSGAQAEEAADEDEEDEEE